MKKKTKVCHSILRLQPLRRRLATGDRGKGSELSRDCVAAGLNPLARAEPVTPHHEGTGTSPITVAFEETSLELTWPDPNVAGGSWHGAGDSENKQRTLAMKLEGHRPIYALYIASFTLFSANAKSRPGLPRRRMPQ